VRNNGYINSTNLVIYFFALDGMYENHLSCEQSPRFSQCRKGERRKFAQQEAVIGQERLSKQQTSPKLLSMEGGLLYWNGSCCPIRSHPDLRLQNQVPYPLFHSRRPDTMPTDCRLACLFSPPISTRALLIMTGHELIMAGVQPPKNRR